MDQQIQALIKSIHERVNSINTRVNDIDQRTRHLEQIAPTFATKDDLKAFATKDDLNAFATKDDLNAFATKDDLNAFATKDDLNPFATKDDLNAFATKDDVREEGERTRRHFDIVAAKSSAEIALIAEGHDGTKEYVDRELTEVKSTLSSHDGRIMKLESDFDKASPSEAVKRDRRVIYLDANRERTRPLDQPHHIR